MRSDQNYTTKEIYFFDSYALIEILRGNKNYKKYTNAVIITTKLNLFEVYYGILRDLNEKLADSYIDKYYKFIVDFDKEILKEAVKLRLKYKKRNLSMVDCVGYSLAKSYGVKFLTGDEQFKDLGNVEFVK